MSSADEETQPKLPVILIDAHQNETNFIHPELLTLSLPPAKSNVTSSSLNNTATRKINAKNVDLNENTDGFITQINVDDATIGIKPGVKQNSSYNIQTLDPQLLIPTENKKPTHHQANFMRLHSSSNNNNTSAEQSLSKKEASFIDFNQDLPPPPPPPTSHHHFLTRLNTKVDFNDTTLSDEYYEDLNYTTNVKEAPLGASSARKSHANFRHPSHHQMNKSKTDLNSINELSTGDAKTSAKAGGGSIFSFFPNIPGKSMILNTTSAKKHENKNKFTAQKSYFDRNIYVQYLTGKLEKPKDDINQTTSLIRIHQQHNILPKSLTRLERRHQSKSLNAASSYTRSTSNRTRLSGETSFFPHAQATSSTSVIDSSTTGEKQVFVDFKGVKSPPPSQLGKPMTKMMPKPPKTQHNYSRTRNVNPRFRNYDKIFRKDNAFLGRKGFYSHSFSNNRETKVIPTLPTSYSTMSHAKPFKKIIDLNQLNNDSKLSSHYMAYQSASHLSELKLHDVWPSSKMYKVTIKSNPWVDKYESISYAHEVNDSFRHFKPSNRLPTIKTQVF